MNTYGSTEWLRIATAGIVSRKERERARQELLDHMEDHAQTLTAQGLSPSAGRERACAAMGDPYEVGRLLRKVHQPVLTRLLQLCRRAAVVLAIVTVCSTLLFSNWYPPLGWLTQLFSQPETGFLSFQVDPLPEGVDWRMIATPKSAAQAGDYKVSVRRVAVTYIGGENPWYVSLELRFTPRWFWQPDAVPFYDFTLRSQDWECHSDMVSYPEELYVTSYYELLYMSGSFPTLPETLEVEYRGPQNRFTLPIDLTGGVVYEK